VQLQLWRVRGCDHAALEEVYPAIYFVHEAVYSTLILADILEFESLSGFHGTILPMRRERALIDKRMRIIERIDDRM
jgi:hypothetical protein